MTADSTVDTLLFLNTVPLEESIRYVVAASPDAPVRQVESDSSVVPLA